MREVFRPVPESAAVVRRPSGEVAKQPCLPAGRPEARRPIHAKLIEPQGKPRKTGLVEYPLLPLQEWAGQAENSAENMPFWKLVLLLIAGMLSPDADTEAKAET